MLNVILQGPQMLGQTASPRQSPGQPARATSPRLANAPQAQRAPSPHGTSPATAGTASPKPGRSASPRMAPTRVVEGGAIQEQSPAEKVGFRPIREGAEHGGSPRGKSVGGATVRQPKPIGPGGPGSNILVPQIGRNTLQVTY